MSDIFDEQQKLTHRIEGLVNSFGDDVAKTLEGALSEVEGKLLLLQTKAAETDSLRRRKVYLEKQREEITKVLNDVYAGLGETVKVRAIELAQAMPKLIAKITLEGLGTGFEIGFSIPKLSTPETLAWFESSQIEGQFFSEFLKTLEKNTADRVIAESRRSLVLHDGTAANAKRIQEALNAGRRGAQTLMNTALQQAVCWAELEFYKENERISQVLFVCELDRRVCPICRELDQTVMDTKEAAKSMPPLHANCRCRLFPMIDGVDIYSPKGAKRVSRKETRPKTVQHRDGTTSTDYQEFATELVDFKTDYNSWMNSMVSSTDPKDVAFAREALGPTRFNLVRDGKLEMNNLYYNGKLRTIKELERLTNG